MGAPTKKATAIPKARTHRATAPKPRMTDEDRADVAGALAVLNDLGEEFTPLDDVARKLGLRN